MILFIVSAAFLHYFFQMHMFNLQTIILIRSFTDFKMKLIKTIYMYNKINLLKVLGVLPSSLLVDFFFKFI